MAQEEPKLSETEELQKKCEEYLNGWKRERADFLNYKKEEMERISCLVKYANEEIILKLLPVLDNLYLAETHIKDDGITQIIKQFEDILAKEGIEPIEVMGKPFDPATMEAVGEALEGPTLQQSGGERVSAETGAVAEEVQRGYTLNAKLIRVAKVKISK